MEEHSHTTVHVARNPDGTCRRSVTIVEHGSFLKLVAKEGRPEAHAIQEFQGGHAEG